MRSSGAWEYCVLLKISFQISKHTDLDRFLAVLSWLCGREKIIDERNSDSQGNVCKNVRK